MPTFQGIHTHQRVLTVNYYVQCIYYQRFAFFKGKYTKKNTKDFNYQTFFTFFTKDIAILDELS